MDPIGERQRELEAKSSLTNAEMQELMKLKPGAFLKLPDLNTIGVKDLSKAIEGLRSLTDHQTYAEKVGCYIEVISIVLQRLELWLRLYWVAKNASGRIFEPDDRKTFGTLISDCEKLGMPVDLVLRLRAFNQKRIDAIHNYILGGIAYEELKQVCDADAPGLLSNTKTWVSEAIGLPIASEPEARA